MKENKYDDPIFFEKYSHMLRSEKGLDGAGEWPALRQMLPEFQGKTVLDLGCGYGWHCRYAVSKGAKQVIGVDISREMLKRAEEINGDEKIQYRREAMEDLEFPQGSFHVVLSSLALHYVEDYEGLIKKIHRWLKPGGDLVFSVEHPVFTAYGSQDWYYDEKGQILHFPVDRYFYEGKREAVFLGEPVIKYHRTLTTYLNVLWRQGFLVKKVVEPEPPAEMMDLPGMADEMRRPMMLLVAAST